MSFKKTGTDSGLQVDWALPRHDGQQKQGQTQALHQRIEGRSDASRMRENHPKGFPQCMHAHSVPTHDLSHDQTFLICSRLKLGRISFKIH